METEQVLLEEVQEQVEVWVEAAAEAEWVAIVQVPAQQETVFARAVEKKYLIRREFPAILSIVLNVEQKWLEDRI